jgi:hypothetical protein
MFDAMFNPKKRVNFLEACHAMGKEAIVSTSLDPDAITKAPYYGLMRYCSYNTNLLGDPALNVWTDVPKDVTASTFETNASKTSFTMKTRPYACVLLADPSNDEFITAQITGYKYNADVSFVVGDSTCSITDDSYKAFAANNSKVKVYIKVPNYIPASFEVDITGTGISNNNLKFVKNYTIQKINGATILNFAVDSDREINLSLFNVKGALVKTLMNKKVRAGENQRVLIRNSELSSGLYYCKIASDGFQSIRDFVVTK